MLIFFKIIQLQVLRSKISTAKVSNRNRYLPKVFTEKGLYMLATILKSRKSVEVTFAIIETFVKVRSVKQELIDLAGLNLYNASYPPFRATPLKIICLLSLSFFKYRCVVLRLRPNRFDKVGAFNPGL